MRTMTGSIGMVVLAAVMSLSGHADAAAPPRVEGQDCRVLAAKIGSDKVWQTTFWAWRTDDFGFREEYFVAPCFASEAACKAWLYWTRSDWDPDYVPPQPCRRGTR